MTEEKRRSYISNLLKERAQHERAGRVDRVRAVDYELRRIGHGTTPVKRAAKRG